MDLEELIEQAGDLEEPPPGRAPRKWFPEVISVCIRLVVLPFIWLDSLAQKIAKCFVPPPFKRVGKCKKRGNCCYYILIRSSGKGLGLLDLFWHTQINGFFRRNKEPYQIKGKPYYLMGCRYLKKDGSCGNYLLRPMICRAWPRIEIFGRPEVLKGCGYSAVKRKGYSHLKLPIIDE